MAQSTQVKLAELRDAAERAILAQYARYSGYGVVAAVERSDGKIYGGANIENVNLTLTKHAEEAAVMAAIADGALRLGDKWLTAVYTQGAPPCGGCRQFLWEFATEDAVCVVDDRDDTAYETTLADLLPYPFDTSVLPDRRGEGSTASDPRC